MNFEQNETIKKLASLADEIVKKPFDYPTKENIYNVIDLFDDLDLDFNDVAVFDAELIQIDVLKYSIEQYFCDEYRLNFSVDFMTRQKFLDLKKIGVDPDDIENHLYRFDTCKYYNNWDFVYFDFYRSEYDYMNNQKLSDIIKNNLIDLKAV